MPKKSFKIDNNIYDVEIIKQAIKDFKDVFEASFNGDLLEIEAENEIEIEEFFGEFMNYVLGLQNENL
ncbi:MAG: HxsD-like protein [Candidatus Peribacteria bacterium]|jgi:hypothetical protein|nr:HxsD-like protein [Candidatus Peribacteria bacterium]